MSEHDNKHLDQSERTDGLTNGNATQSDASDISNLSELSPAEAILSEPEIEPDADYERGREQRAKRHKTMNKFCGISCTLFGTVGTLAIGACTAMACILYGSTGPGDITQPDRFVPVISEPSGDDGRIPAESSSSSDSGTSTQSSESSRPSSSNNDSGSSSAGTQSQPSSGSSPHGDSQSRPSDRPAESSKPSESSRPSDGQASTASGGSSDPGTSTVLPDTGEDMAGRVSAATETELLRAQSKRVARGESPYNTTDIRISIGGGLGISDISKAYGFSVDFIRKYNDHGRTDDIIRIPRL